MAKQGEFGISWTDFTFNPWHGCVRVSPACTFCYAASQDARYFPEDAHWGKFARRRFLSDAYWNGPLKWNEEAHRAGVRARVFCGSMCDVCEILPEGHPDTSRMEVERARLMLLVENTPSLDWLFLTKRPENYLPLFDWGGRWPKNIWTGTTAEDQERADERVPHLLRVPSAVRFLSCEPLLGPLDLFKVGKGHIRTTALNGGWSVPQNNPAHYQQEPRIHWVIAGGESGPKARPSHPDWFRSLRDQCKEAGVAYHFKQWGCWRPAGNGKETQGTPLRGMYGTAEGRWSQERIPPPSELMIHTDKKSAGRILDGRTWDQFPERERSA